MPSPKGSRSIASTISALGTFGLPARPVYPSAVLRSVPLHPPLELPPTLPIRPGPAPLDSVSVLGSRALAMPLWLSRPLLPTSRSTPRSPGGPLGRHIPSSRMGSTSGLATFHARIALYTTHDFSPITFIWRNEINSHRRPASCPARTTSAYLLNARMGTSVTRGRTITSTVRHRLFALA